MTTRVKAPTVYLPCRNREELQTEIAKWISRRIAQLDKEKYSVKASARGAIDRAASELRNLRLDIEAIQFEKWSMEVEQEETTD